MLAASLYFKGPARPLCPQVLFWQANRGLRTQSNQRIEHSSSADSPRNRQLASTHRIGTCTPRGAPSRFISPARKPHVEVRIGVKHGLQQAGTEGASETMEWRAALALHAVVQLEATTPPGATLRPSAPPWGPLRPQKPSRAPAARRPAPSCPTRAGPGREWHRPRRPACRAGPSCRYASRAPPTP